MGNSDATSAVVDLGLLHFRGKSPRSGSRLKMSAYCRTSITVTGSESTVPADHEEAQGIPACAGFIAFLELRDVHDVQHGRHSPARRTTSSNRSGTIGCSGGADAGATSSGGGAAADVGTCGVGADGSTGAGIGARASAATSRSAVMVGKGVDGGGASEAEESL
eukprot:NODE_2491_length_925_cov_126.071264.p2 GENE.NODE_2491_length_925_cov_126.071264~~NODE_2491_length_925_cov_126.071264.p2  ORF type:complete len:164 (+),score=33.19 NODE_2491_length_925_cov_126.071264:3-494(+)